MFADRNISLVVLARFISRVGGTAVFFVGIWGVAAYHFNVTASTLAILMAGSSITGIIGSVVAGVLVDRIGPRKVLLGAELLTIPVMVALSFAHTYSTFVGIAWLFGLVGSPTFTAGAAFAPYLVRGRPRDLERINGWIEAAGSAGFVLGPALGALCASLWGLPSVFIVAAVAAAVAAVVVWFVHINVAERTGEEQHPLAELKDGLRVAYTTRALRYAILVGTTVWFGFGAFSALEPLFYRDVVHVGVEWIGWMNTFFSFGLVLGAWGLSRLPAKVVSSRGLCVVGALCGLGAIAYVGSTQLPLIAAGAAVWGLVIGLAEPLLRTMLQVAAPEGYVGRVVGAAQYHREAGELVPLAIAPAAAAAFGVQPTLIAGGVIVAVLLLLTWPAAASIDRELAEQGLVAGRAASGPARVGIGDEVL
ncbi:MAG: MFS transporter [Coriobacteriia bacterium]|nr:MFS transporter [Coriobacteriia bacterium]